MAEIAIRVEELSKQYRIGTRERYRTLRDNIASAAAVPLRVLRAARNGNGRAPAGRPVIWALKNVSFDVAPGEVVGIIGRNGAGKSTLLKVLSRITDPTEGYAEIHGRVGSLLEVGTGFHPELTGRENVFLNGAILGMRRGEIAHKFDEIVEFAEVAEFIDTPVKHYSNGMYLRLAFSVAAHLEPEILVVDEVLAVGDVAFQKKCIGKMGDVARQGRTVLFVSHNMSAVESLCTRCIALAGGSIFASGEPTEIVRRYVLSSTAASERRNEPAAGRSTAAWFSGILFRNAAGEPADTFCSGDEIVADIAITCRRPVHGAVVGLTLSTIHGLPVANIRSEDGGFTFELSEGENRLTIAFRLANFLSNTFAVHLGMTHRGAEVLDFFSNAAQLTLIAGDLSGHGKTRQKGELVYVPAEWSQPCVPVR